MKTLNTVLLILLLSTWTFPASAQHQHNAMTAKTDTSGQGGMMQGAMMKGGMMQGAMMQGDMMQGMMRTMHDASLQMISRSMNDPIKRADLFQKTLPSLGDFLSLTEEQAVSATIAVRETEEEYSVLNEELEVAEETLAELLSSESPDRITARTLISEIAVYRADLNSLGFMNIEKSLAILTGDQREKLLAMTPMQMHHNLMMNATMMEMMQIMGANHNRR